MNKVKILCLGNEFIEEDSLAKIVGNKLKEEFEVIDIRDSFQLMGIFEEKGEFVILDVVDKLEKVILLEIDDLKSDSILSAHDFDAGQVLKLLKPDVKIIGIPMKGDECEILKSVRDLL